LLPAGVPGVYPHRAEASEQWNLRRSDIDLKRRILTVRKQKSGKGERHIPLNQVAVSAFEQLRALKNPPVSLF